MKEFLKKMLIKEENTKSPLPKKIRIDFGEEVGYTLEEGEWVYHVSEQQNPEATLHFQSQLFFDIGATLTITLFGYTENKVKVVNCKESNGVYDVEIAFTTLHPDALIMLEQMHRLSFLLDE